VHGRPHEVALASATVVLYPLYHPAAALYTPSMLRALEEDFARIPGLLGHSGRVGAPHRAERVPVPAAAADGAGASGAVQLDLF